MASSLTHKQLFLTDFKIKDKEILIENKDLLSQVRKVLRLQKGNSFYVQNNGVRYKVEIKDWDDKVLKGEIIEDAGTNPYPKGSPSLSQGTQVTGMIISMPNKWEKVELIVQKLTEIGLDEIIFWPSERSVIRQRNEKKSERLNKIVNEAVEQSRGWKVPKVSFVTDIKDVVKDKFVIVFDKKDNENHEQKSDTSHSTFGLIGPEGGLTERDYEVLKGIEYKVRGLGENVLRMETAAIVGGWIIKNGD